MILKSIEFESYKSFPKRERIIVKPITIVIGKNSSGKSAFSRLPLLLANSFSSDVEEPITVNHNGVEFGGSFTDLVYNKLIRGNIKFEINFENELQIACEIQGLDRGFSPIIKHWSIRSEMLNLDIEIELTDENLSKEKDINYVGKGKTYEITFQGLIPISIKENNKEIDHQILDIIVRKFHIFSKNVNYIGPYRQVPQRVYFHTGQSLTKLGVRGEFAPQILGNAAAKNLNLVNAVGDWYQENLGGWRVDIQQIEDFFQIVLISPDNPNVKINIVDVGQGMSQVLPLVVQCLLKEKQKGEICIVEQPELHLHPAAHGSLAELFANSANSQGCKYILETHSENIILRLRRLVVEGSLSSDDVIIYWIDDENGPGSTVKTITIDNDGEMSDWPTGVFSEDYEEVIAIREAQKKKNANTNIS